MIDEPRAGVASPPRYVRVVRSNALSALIALALAGCECGADELSRADRPRGGGPGSAGGDQTDDGSRGPAAALRAAGEGVPAPTRFEPIDPSQAAGSTRARGWASLEDLRGGATARLSLGNWLCRIWTHYGPPPEVQPDGFVYAFRDRESGEVITAYSAGSGPAMGGVIVGADRLPIAGAQQRVAASVDAFVALIDATTPVDCELALSTDYGPIRVGVRGGEWYEDNAD